MATLVEGALKCACCGLQRCSGHSANELGGKLHSKDFPRTIYVLRRECFQFLNFQFTLFGGFLCIVAWFVCTISKCTVSRSKELRAKGFDSYVVSCWLNDVLQRHPPPHCCQKVAVLLWLADSFMGVLSSAPDFMALPQREHVSAVGNAWLRLYIDLASNEPMNWRVRPKHHLLWHAVNDPLRRCSGRNPTADSTWLDEDWIKKIQRLCKKCHRVTAQKTVLQRWLVGLQQKLRSG